MNQQIESNILNNIKSNYIDLGVFPAPEEVAEIIKTCESIASKQEDGSYFEVRKVG